MMISMKLSLTFTFANMFDIIKDSQFEDYTPICLSFCAYRASSSCGSQLHKMGAKTADSMLVEGIASTKRTCWSL